MRGKLICAFLTDCYQSETICFGTDSYQSQFFFTNHLNLILPYPDFNLPPIHILNTFIT